MSSAACCAGVVDTGNPTGTVETIHNLSCYVAKPQTIQNNHVLIIATDVFGYKLPNTRLIADKFSKELQCQVIIPDLFKGTEPPPILMFDFEVLMSKEKSFSWFQKIYSFSRIMYYLPFFIYQNSKEKNTLQLSQFIQQYKTENPQSKVFCQGYCWGGYIAIQLSHQELLTAAVTTHPGSVKFPKDIELVKTPICFQIAEYDFEIKEKQVDEIRTIMKDKEFNWHLDVFKKCNHGFAIRGGVNEQRQKAFEGAVAFLKQFL